MGDDMITVNIGKAKDIAHDVRRAARSVEFAPWTLKQPFLQKP